jgi:hypothetical protein
MATTGTQAGLGNHLKEELANSQRCVEELQKIQKEIAEVHAGSIEIFDFGLYLGPKSAVPDEKVEYLTRACIWHAISLKAEFKLKLLYTIDGYLSAVESKNPISTYLLARYLLELAATVNAIKHELEECSKIGILEWKRRAFTFFGVLYRARHSTSDEKFKSIFAEVGAPGYLLHPIKIGKAIKQLTARGGFESALTAYNSFSNICHHNGSGHKMLIEGARMTNKIVLRNGRRLSVPEEAAAMTLNYPAADFASSALALTARVAWWSAKSANEMIEEIRESPFTDDELSTLTNGRVTTGDQCYGLIKPPRRHNAPLAKLGRNDPCPCGSGKKYKRCCWPNSAEPIAALLNRAH